MASKRDAHQKLKQVLVAHLVSHEAPSLTSPAQQSRLY
jgi:hypothetical protein